MRNAFHSPILALLGALCALCLASPAAAGGAERIFPYPVHKRTLANGLDVLAIPMPEFKEFLSFNTMVLVGSRNETDKGHTGEAHLFEHIVFQHRLDGEPDGYNKALRATGAFRNAFTNPEITFYYPQLFNRYLRKIFELEAARFVHLNIDEDIYRTETGAVLGEYRKSAALPDYPLAEALLRMMYPEGYGYGHTTLGYKEDIEEMPLHFEHAMKFYRTWYRPNNVVLIVAGDVDPKEVFALAQEYFGEWQRAELPQLPEPAESIGGPKREDLSWASEVPPRVWVGHRAPPFRSAAAECAVAQLLPDLLTHPTSPLYQELRFRKGLASALTSWREDTETFGPGQFVIDAEIFPEQFAKLGSPVLDTVIAEVERALGDLRRFSKLKGAKRVLKALQKKRRYDLLARLNSPANAARALSWYYRFERDPAAIDVLVNSVENLKTKDIEAFARRYFVPENRVVVTLSPGAPEPKGAERAPVR